MNNNTISNEERYRFVTAQIRYLNEKIIEVFTFFLKLITAIIGGLFWIRFQQAPGGNLSNIDLVARLLVTLVGAGAILLIVVNCQTWRGFRMAESELVGKNGQNEWIVPPPSFPWSYRQEISMTALIASCVLAAWFLL